MKLLIGTLLVIAGLSGCATREPKQDPAVAVAKTQIALEIASRASGDAIKDLNTAIAAAEKNLNEAEKQLSEAEKLRTQK